MENNTYVLINKFKCCGKNMVTVITKEKACVMEEWEYNKIVKLEWIAKKYGL